MYPRSWSCKWGKTRFLLCLSDSQSNLFYHWDCHCPYFSRESVGLCFWLELEREENWNWREEDKVDLQWKKCHMAINIRGLPHSSISKEAAFNAGDPGWIPGSGRSPGEGNSYLFQYSGQENSMDCIVHGVAKSQMWLSDFHFGF